MPSHETLEERLERIRRERVGITEEPTVTAVAEPEKETLQQRLARIREERAELIPTEVTVPETVSTIQDVTAGRVSIPPSKPNSFQELIKKSVETGTEFFKGIPTDPMGTIRGGTRGFNKATSVPIGGGFRLGIGGLLFPETEKPVTEQEKRAEAVGEFGTRVLEGVALGALVPVTGIVSFLGAGAVANIPFVMKAFETGGVKDATSEAILGTAFDVLLFGGGKVVGKVARKQLLNATKEFLTKKAWSKEGKVLIDELSPSSIKAFKKHGDEIEQLIRFDREAEEWIFTDEFLKRKGIKPKIKPQVEVPEELTKFKFLNLVPENIRVLFSKPTPQKNTSFTVLAQKALDSSLDESKESAFEFVGKKANTILKELDTKRASNGIIKAAEASLAEQRGVKISVAEWIDEWDAALKKDINLVAKEGKISAIPGRINRSPKEIGLVQDVEDIVFQVRNSMDSNGAVSPKLFDDAITAIGNQLNFTELPKQKTIVNKIAKGIRRNGRELLVQGIGEDYGRAVSRYSDLVDMRNLLLKGLGKEIDPNEARTMAASLLNAAVHSTSGKGVEAKELFQKIFKETGTDLWLEARYAEIATQGAFDRATKKLLDPTIAAGFIVGGPWSKIFAAKQLTIAQIDKLKGKLINQLTDFYNDQQKKVIGKRRIELKGGEKAKRTLEESLEGLPTIQAGSPLSKTVDEIEAGTRKPGIETPKFIKRELEKGETVIQKKRRRGEFLTEKEEDELLKGLKIDLEDAL